MENCVEKKKDLNISKNEDDINFDKYIKIKQIVFYSMDNLIEKENKEDLMCPICYFVLNNPISCSYKNNSHSFCKDCIDTYLKEKNKCPSCKSIFEYKVNNDIKNELNKLQFHCEFQNKGCDIKLSYSEYLTHINNCKYNNIRCTCNVKKYNFKKKQFEECNFIGSNEEMKKHFNLCGHIKCRCRFCKENILQMNLEEHMKNKCKF